MFEVEVRCHFGDVAEAYAALPFLLPNLQRKCVWETSIYGLKLFQSGQLLRTASLVFDKEPRYYLGWKGPDIGQFANIREEIDEEITSGSSHSSILKLLAGRGSIHDINEAIQELDRLGYSRFMSFEGVDSSGYYAPYGLSLKLMHCPVLQWPLIVELEKTAHTAQEADLRQQELFDLCTLFQLHDRLVKEEPPTLLYNALFPPTLLNDD
jgi:adenylate cyclase class IV